MANNTNPKGYAEWVVGAVNDLLDQGKVTEADVVWETGQLELAPYPALLDWADQRVAEAIVGYQKRTDPAQARQDDDRYPAPARRAADDDAPATSPAKRAKESWTGARSQADAALDRGVNNLKKVVRSKFSGGKKGRRRATVWNQAGEVLIWVMLALLGAILWQWGGLFTILTIEAMFFDGSPVIQSLGPWQWLVPLGVSALETIWWPLNAPTPLRIAFFVATAVLDILSTAYGAAIWLAGRNFPLWVGGIQAPATTAEFGGILVTVILVSSIIITFGPERLILAALREGLGAFLAFWICLWNMLKGWNERLSEG